MRIALLLVLLATPVAAEPRGATFTLQHDTLWPDHERDIAVRAGGGTWRKAKRNRTVGPFAIATRARSAAVMFEVRIGSRRPIRRLAAIVPGTAYRVTGNPCAHWGLDIIEPRPDPDADLPAESVRVDARALPASAFPIELESGGETVTLDKPGVSVAIELSVSAMCPRSGAGVIVRSGGKSIFDETLIAHPGRVHTVRFTKLRAFELLVEL